MGQIQRADYAAWEGDHPETPDWIHLHGHYGATGLSVSVNLGCGGGQSCGGGLTLSASCTCADFNGQVHNHYINHEFAAYPEFTAGYLWSLGESANSEVKIGPNYLDLGAGSDEATIY